MPATLTATRSPVSAKFYAMADALQRDIDAKRADRRSNTPKQQREASSARIDGDHLERIQQAMRALADAREAQTLPTILWNLRTKAAIEPMVKTRIDTSGGYYSVRDTGEYHDQSDAAKSLRLLMAGAETPEDQDKRLRWEKDKYIRELEEKVKFSQIPGFFPTPRAVIDVMLVKADLMHAGCGQRVLEPSAGKGDLADAICERMGVSAGDSHGSLQLFEINHMLCEILRAKGFEVLQSDFLETVPVPKYDRILQNPPFEKSQDISHLQHAYLNLKPNGRVVSIMSPGPFFGSNAKQVAFREWFEAVNGEVSDLPEGSFKDSFRSTGVATKLVVINR